METLSKLLREPVQVTGCGRTDTGVHASDFYAHFDTEKEFDKNNIIFKCNCMLPNGIVVYDVFPVMQDFHTRFSAVSRTYHYFIHQFKNPFIEDTSYYMREKLDVTKMNEAVDLLLGKKDFSCFSKAHTDTKTNICTIDMAKWEVEGTALKFTIKADRFLRNMVRAIVGTMLDIGRGKLEVDDLNKIIESGDRGKAGYSVPACGLFLANIEYPKGVFTEKE